VSASPAPVRAALPLSPVLARGGRALIEEARGWLADLQWADEPDFDALTDEQVIRAVSRHYDGGWDAFAESGATS
jgi:hypothetical protein